MLHAGGTGLILGRGTRIPHTTWCDQKKIKKKCWKRHLFKGPTALELPAFRKGGLEGPKLLFIKEVLKIPIFMCPLSLLLLFFSRSVMSDSLQCHGLQHARLPCPSPTCGACSNSCPLSQWCHPTISSSVVPIVDLKCCVSFSCTAKCFSYSYIYIYFFQIIFPYRLLQNRV